MHQLVEYILGGALVMMGLQSPTPVVPAAVGGIVMAHAAFTQGPIAGFQLIPRRLHRWIDVGVIAVEVVAAVQPWISVESGTRVVLAGIAFVHAFVWWNSSYAQRPSRVQWWATISVPTATAGGSSAAVDRSTEFGRRAGRIVGKGVRAYQDRKPKSTG